MSETDVPDVSDPDIRAMVFRDHEPTEQWLGPPGGRRCFVHCATCRHDWPCPSIKAAKAAEAAS